MSESGITLVKIFLFGILFVGAVSVIVITYNIVNSNAPEVLSNCVSGKLEKIHTSESKILSLDSAKKAIMPLFDAQPEFTGSVLEPCGVGYVFENGDEKYVVCEDGTISKYVTLCKNDSIVDKGSNYVQTLKEGVSLNEQ